MKGKHCQKPEELQIGVDFGESMTVIAVSDPDKGCYSLEFPGISRSFLTRTDTSPVHGIPALIQFEKGTCIRVGEEVARAGGENLPTTARWMRRYLCDRSPAQIAAGNNRLVNYEDAAAEYLGMILKRIPDVHRHTRLVFALPADAPAHYPDFLDRIARAAGAFSCSFVHELPSAMRGYGVLPHAGDPILIIQYTDTGVAVSALTLDGHEEGTGGMRVLARASGTAGCRAIDTWIMQDMVQKFRLLESDPRAIRICPQMMYEAGRLREHFSHADERTIHLTDDISKKTFTATYTTADMDRILKAHEVIPSLLDCISRTLSALQMRGADTGRIRQVLLLGEGCMIPAVREAIQARFPTGTVQADHPVDAIARGAAFHTIQVKRENRIFHTYALRYWNVPAQEHHYRFLVHSSTPYPSRGQVARIIISAAYDGQTHLGIPIYRMGGSELEQVPEIELVSEPGGGVRLAGPEQEPDARGKAVHVNEMTPTLLVATPPAKKGEPRFECTFTLDAERNLCLMARDLITGAVVKENEPVHQLT